MSITMSREEVEAKIVEALAELGPEPDELVRDKWLVALEIDSLDLIELVQVIEEEIGAQVREEDRKRLQTLGDLFDLVWERAQ